MSSAKVRLSLVSVAANTTQGAAKETSHKPWTSEQKTDLHRLVGDVEGPVTRRHWEEIGAKVGHPHNLCKAQYYATRPRVSTAAGQELSAVKKAPRSLWTQSDLDSLDNWARGLTRIEATMDDCLTLPMRFHKLSLMSIFNHLKPVKATIRAELAQWTEKVEEPSWAGFIVSPPADRFPALGEDEFDSEMILVEKRKRSNRTHSATTLLNPAHAGLLKAWSRQFPSWVSIENLLDPTKHWPSSELGNYRMRTLVSELHLLNVDSRAQGVLSREQVNNN